MEGQLLQLGAVGVLGLAMLALIRQVAVMAQAIGRLEATVSTFVQLVATRDGIRMPDPAPAQQRPPAKVMDMVKGGVGN